MASLFDNIRSHRLLLLGLLPLLLALEGDRPFAAIGGDPGARADRRPLPGAGLPELGLPEDDGIPVSATETMQPMASGLARRVVSLSPVRWVDDSGEWHAVDARFAEDGPGFRTESDSLTCQFPVRSDGAFSVVPTTGGPRLSWRADSMEIHRFGGARFVVASAPEPVQGKQQSDGSLVYEGIWPGVSERYRLEPGLAKHEVVLHAMPPAVPGDELVLSWTLRVEDSSLLRTPLPVARRSYDLVPDDAGGFRVVDSEGVARLWLPAPYLVEDLDALLVERGQALPGLPSAMDPADMDRPAPLALSWRSEPTDEGLRLELVLPVTELFAREAGFPLVIDPTVVDLASSAGVLTVHGAERFDLLGDRRGLAAGDFNGDGHLDLAVGAHRGDGLGDTRTDAGELHLLFGPLGDGSRDLDIDKGDVVISGADRYDTFAWSVAAGDLNGDGVDDLLVGAPFADGPDNRRSGAGEALVLMGPFAPGEIRDLGLMPPDALLHGGARAHGAGYAVAIGDVTGDGVGDALVSSHRSDGPQGDRESAGAVHVMAGPFHRGPARRVVDLAIAPADATIHGEAAGDQLGASLAAGDLDGNGIADIAVGSLSSDGRNDGRPRAGEIHVLLGPISGGSLLDLAVGVADARVFGAQPGDLLGHDLDIGDISGDGVGDLIAGAHLSDGPRGLRDRAGSVAVVFGPLAGGLQVDLALGDADVLLHGADRTDLTGWSVGVGDLSGDGRADLVFGGVAADGPGNSRSSAGEIHALFGPFVSGSVVDLAVSPSDFEVQGANRSDQLGYSVGVADLSGDGVGDLMGAAKTARGPGESRPAAGEAVVVQGRAVGCRGNADCNDGVDCTLDICDGMTGECVIDDTPCNLPPSCDVGEDRKAACREIDLQGITVEDPDGDAMDYSWTSSDPMVTVRPAAGSFGPGEGVRSLPTSVAGLAATEFACGREAILTLTVRDGRGGETSCHLRVGFTDQQAPVLLGVPSNAIVDCDAVPPPAEVTASDGCDHRPSLAFGELRTDGSCPGEYRLERTWRAVDACGNVREQSQVIEVVDEVGPVVQPSSERVRCLWPPNHRMVHFDKSDVAPSIEDGCGGETTWRFVDCSSSQAEDDTGDGSTEPDCVVDPDGEGFSVRAERSGNGLDGRHYLIEVVATDACGNESAPTRIGRISVSHGRGLLVGSGDCTEGSRD
jgi:hypothetical protein